jgi:pimeloyl-ACP methyl ester carboxylesterase
MRGYSPGARPKGKEHYLLENLSDDIIQIANALGSQKFHLIGHDWGAAVGWKVAADYHEKVLSLTAISVPHPRAMAKAIKSDPEQRKMSRYIFQILLPFLPEWYLLRKNNRMLRKIWKYCSDQEITEYLKIHGTREGLTATLNYYRANFGRNTRDKRGKVGNVNVKTCYIWGENDHALGSTGAESCGQYVDGAYSFIKLNGGHWLMQRNYEEVKNEILLQLK